MSSVILAAPCVHGEFVPLLEIARHLVGRGHKVSMITGTDFGAQVTAVGARFVPLTGNADITGEMLKGHMAERAAIPPGPEQLNFDWKHLFIDPVPIEHGILQELLQEDPDSLLVTNSAFLGYWPVALEAPGIRPRRWITVGANPVVRASDDSTPLGPVPGLEGEERVARHRQINAQFAAALEPTRALLESHIRALGGDGRVPPLVDGFLELPEVFAVLTVPEFDFPRSDDPDNLRYIGLLPQPAPAEWEPPAWWNELDGPRPVVVVTQGTITNTDLSELVTPTLAALKDQDVLVIAALGREVHSSGIDAPANVRLTGFIPFSKLLPKADLLITNGGFGGTQQALSYGVPVIIAGETEDKPMTAARVAFHGLGLNLGTSRPSVEQIREATKTVLADPKIRDAVNRIVPAYAAHHALDEIEALLA